jgi:hypothetical protein
MVLIILVKRHVQEFIIIIFKIYTLFIPNESTVLPLGVPSQHVFRLSHSEVLISSFFDYDDLPPSFHNEPHDLQRNSLIR